MVKRMIDLRLCVCGLVIVLSLLSANHLAALQSAGTSVSTADVPMINMTQTANMKLAFLGIPAEDVNQTTLESSLPKTFDQFAYPNTINWVLNYSFIFAPFPQNVSDALNEDALHSRSRASFNITLLDSLLPQIPDLAIPEHGYLLVFMSIPNATDHSWFYVPPVLQALGILPNTTTYFNGGLGSSNPATDFGGLQRALYFDLSDMMQENMTLWNSVLTYTVQEKITNSLPDVFTGLLGNIDARWIAADMQEYRDYNVKILWFNGTQGQSPVDANQICQSFEDLMPWTRWNVTIETEPADKPLNDLIESRTVELQTPLNYTLVLSNGTKLTIMSKKNVIWPTSLQNPETDPLSQYFVNHVKDYFNLTDLQDKSVIPVVMIQTDNDTAFGGSPFGAGVSLFPYNVIITAFQGGALTTFGEIGQLTLTGLIRHETGHWLSLSHHDSGGGDPRILCSMRDTLSDFCPFCKDARARISFISYYNSAITLLTKNQTKAMLLQDQLNGALQLFYDWNYTEAVNEIVNVYYGLDTTPPSISNVTQTPSPNNVSPEEEVTVNATVTDDLSGVKQVILNCSENNGTWNTIEMTNVEGNTWSATIPTCAYGTSVTYIITAEDNFNNVATTREAGQEYGYTVVPECPLFAFLPILTVAVLLAILARRKLNPAETM